MPKASYLLAPICPLRAAVSLVGDKISPRLLDQFVREHALLEPPDTEIHKTPNTVRAIRMFQVIADDVQVFREAGRSAAAPGTLGALRESLLALLHPSAGFRYLGRRLNRQEGVSCRIIRHKKRSLEIHIKVGHPCFSLFQLGLIEGFSHRYLPYKVTVSQTVEDASNKDKFVIKIGWEMPAASKWIGLRNGLFLLTGLLLLLIPILPTGGLALLFATICSTVFFTGAGQMCLHRDLAKDLSNLHRANENLVDQANFSINQAAINEAVHAQLSDSQDFSDVARRINDLLENRLDFCRGLVLIWDRKRGEKSVMPSFGFGHEDLQLLVEHSTLFGRAQEPTAWHRLFRTKQPLIITDLDEESADLTKNTREILQRIGLENLVCTPLVCEQQTVGFILVANVKGKRPPLNSDIMLLNSISTGVGIALQTLSLLHARSEQFKATLQILASSIDARDFLTAGHSDTVTDYAVGICREMKLSANFSEMIRVASMLHDYGKIGVPDHILKKAGPLNAEEREIIRTHPLKGQQILQQIPFFGIFKQIPEIVGAHHEKIDGSGYPLGLMDRQIPLGARIIAVADFFDAITSKRHYREPMPIDVALALLQRGSGNHFDQSVVKAFMRYVQRNRHELEKRANALLRRLDRDQERIPFRTHVSCHVDNNLLSGTSANLSSGGIFIATEYPPPTTDNIEVAFQIPQTSERMLRVRGRVAWINQEEINSSLPKGFGMQFVSLQPEENQALKTFLFSQTIYSLNDLTDDSGTIN